MSRRKAANAVRKQLDANWYLQTNPDVAASRITPAKHYLRWGWKEGRNPTPDFDVRWYLRAYPDVAIAGLEPFGHYLVFGRDEGRLPREPLGDRGEQPPVQVQDSRPPAKVPERVPDVLHTAADSSNTTAPPQRGRVDPLKVRRTQVVLGLDQPPPASLGFLCEHRALLGCATSLGSTFHLEGDALIVKRPTGPSVAIRDRSDLHRLIPFESPSPAVAFVVLQYQASDATLACLDSIRRIEWPGQVSVVLVDNASDDVHVSTIRPALQALPSAHLEVLPSNVGYARGNNVGYRIAVDRFAAEFVVCLNPDVVIDGPLFLHQLVEAFREYPYSVLAPRIHAEREPHGYNPIANVVPTSEGWAKLEVEYERCKTAFYRDSNVEFPTIGDRSPDARQLVGCIPQGCALVFSPVFTKTMVKPFDERTFLYGEEFLLATLAQQSGHPILYEPRISITHTGGRSTDSMPARQKLVAGYENGLLAARTCRTRWEAYEAGETGRLLELSQQQITELTGDGRRHVLVDLVFAQPGQSGGAEYGRAVFEAIARTATRRPEVQVWGAVDPTLPVEDWLRDLARDSNVYLVQTPGFAGVADLVNFDLFDSFFAPALIIYTGYEYLTSPPTGMMLRPSRTKVHGTIHDVRDLEFAESWEQNLTWNDGLPIGSVSSRALSSMYASLFGSEVISEIVMASDAALASARERVPASRQRAVAVRYPPMPADRPLQDVRGTPSISVSEYLVTVAADRPEKNALRVVEAFTRLVEQDRLSDHPNMALVAMGGLSLESHPGWRHSMRHGRVILLPYVSREEFSALVGGARALLYPSLSEGFGYPPLQAMAAGVPSLVSAIPVTQEVLGEAARYCDPFSVQSIAEGIIEVLSGPPNEETLNQQLQIVSQRQTDDLRLLVDSLLAG